MNLSKELSLINQKDYEPVFTAKLQSSLILSKRPKTSIYELSKENNNRNNISSSLSRNVSSAKSSISNLIQFKKSDTKQQDTINNKRKKSIKFNNNEEEDEDDNMTNISLLSVNSYETVRPKKIYGKFQTFSLFERYMNRRAKIKLQPHMNPKLPPEYQNQPEPTLFDLLSDDELSILYDMYKIDVAVPFRLRSFSVAFDRTSFTYPSKNKIKKRSNSVEKSTNVKITNVNDTQSKDIKSFMQKSSKINDNESDDFDIDRSTLPSFDTRGIKGPIIYQIGSSSALLTTPKSNKIENQKKNNPLKNMDLFNINNILSTRTKAYNHVKSNLESIFHDSPKIKENSFINYSKSALDRHNETFTPYIKYSKIQTKSIVQMSDLLENKIRENLKMNRGPIYYGQFTQENIRLHNKNKQKLKRQDKFYNIYEWLEKIDVKQCSHFFMNPFKRDKNNLTDECDLNLNWREAARTAPVRKKADMNLFRFKIDPFDNPKNITTKLESKRNERFFGGIQTYYQTFDQQTLIAKKDYTNLLHLEPTLFNRKSTMIDFKNNDDLISSASSNYRKNYALDQRANLKKQKFLNDSYLLRMQLDLYIL